VVIPADKDINWGKPTVAVQGSGTDKTAGVKATVTYVGDGDGATLKAGKNTLNCRIQGIDAPEVDHKAHNKKGQPYGQEAKKSLQDMILNKEVTVTVTKVANAAATDSSSRSTCKIEIHGKNVSTEQLKNGSAWLWETFNTDKASAQANRDAFAFAKSNKLGLHANPDAVEPKVFKAIERKQELGRYW
jgi:endonuclease YncB( thermonuclease family)